MSSGFLKAITYWPPIQTLLQSNVLACRLWLTAMG